MSYFEKSAALNLQLGNIDASRNDLQSSYTIAVALNDTDSVNRLQNLLAEMQPAPMDAPFEPVTPEMPDENQQ